MSPNDRDHADAANDIHPSDDATLADDATSADDADAEDTDEVDDVDVGELRADLMRLREEVTQLRARQAASRHSSWVQRHPALTVFLTTALGAAAGYLGSRLNTSSGFSEATREQLRLLAEQARAVASDVQHEIESFGPLGGRSNGGEGDESPTAGTAPGGDGASATAQTPAGDASAGAPRGPREETGFSMDNVLQSVAGTASRAHEKVRTQAKSATQDAAARAVRNFASEDDIVPVEVKAKAAGMAATTLGAALARKLARSAGSVLASMLIAYLTKKVLDLVFRR
jgi:ElaB/YqjD/DUF883 family membrane-anchored ribosome-binding protein